ncbi:uncharacterized protein LOC143915329 [Arctopsyche grandis]|uniref:uncharacterized protein LOC143915329 n=1 Tax=Arctopsyche grandis TaxID=121162 RepID=UPI00406D634B
MASEKVVEMAKDAVESVKESFDDFGSGIPMPSEGSDQPFQMPTKDELLAMLDTMGLGDQEKEELRAALLSGDPLMPERQPWTSQALILLPFLLLIASIFVFFGYKLYRSMKDKEVMREEKRQKRQMKKRK